MMMNMIIVQRRWITTNKGQELWKSQDVEDFVPVYQDTTNPASQFRILLANTGFAIRSASSFPQDLILNFYLKEMWGRSVHFHFPEPKRTSFSAEVFSFFDTPIDIKPYQFLWVNYFFTQGCQSLPGKDSPGKLIFLSAIEEAPIPLKSVQNQMVKKVPILALLPGSTAGVSGGLFPRFGKVTIF